MLTFSFAFAIICFAILLLFFSGLPNLKTCLLPHSVCLTEPDHKNRLAVILITFLYAIVAFWHLGNTDSPQTFVPMEGHSVRLTLLGSAKLNQLVLFPGVGQGEYLIESLIPVLFRIMLQSLNGNISLSQFRKTHATSASSALAESHGLEN